MTSSGDRHRRAAATHDLAARRHEAAAAHWTELDDLERVELEQRNAEIEHAAARLERDRADLEDRRRGADS